MTSEQEEKARKFFAMLASHGIKEILCTAPPVGGSVVGKIEENGDISMKNREGKYKKIKMG